MLNWGNQFNICCFMNNHAYQATPSTYEGLLAVGAHRSIGITGATTQMVDHFIATNTDWIFGHFNYEFAVNDDPATLSDQSSFEPAFLFVPETVITLAGNELIIGSVNSPSADIFLQITNAKVDEPSIPKAIELTPRINRQQYITIINNLLNHIKRGDCYEINFCQEFFTQQTLVDVMHVYQKLVAISPNPFACYYRLHNQHLLCASPERYLKKTGNTLISQPIKGTLSRSLPAKLNDTAEQTELYNSKKDRAENVMVVDLVRNDMSKICERGSVKVDELFGIYTFPQLYQMISTVSGVLKENTTLGQILQATFPMGSMTGAPKKRVMELIQQYETGQRGIYSGTVGYITPNRNFDFNVVIRSLVYNADTQYLSYHVGSGITSNSVAEHEYEECKVKAAAIVAALSAKQ